MEERTNEKEMEALLREVKAMMDGGAYIDVARKKVIGVIGVGGAGNNILASLYRMGLKDMKNVETIAINSDEKVLELLKDINKRVLIGKSISEHPKGTAGDMKLARKMIKAAEESLEVMIGPYQIIILVGSLGGGTGAELMIELSKMGMEKGKVVMAIPVLPFSVEGSRRAMAKRNLERLENTGAMVIPMDNDSLVKDERMKKLSLDKAFESLNRIIFRKIKEIQDDTLNNIVEAIVDEMYRKLQTEIMMSAQQDAPVMGPPSMSMPNAPSPVTAKKDLENDVPPDMKEIDKKPI